MAGRSVARHRDRRLAARGTAGWDDGRARTAEWRRAADARRRTRFKELLALSDEAVAAGSRGFAPVRHAAPKSSADAVTQLRWARERCRWHNGHGRSSSSGHGP